MLTDLNKFVNDTTEWYREMSKIYKKRRRR